MEVETVNKSCIRETSHSEKLAARSFGDQIVSHQDVKVVVERALGPRTKLIGYYLRTYSEEKLGFMGAHRHLVVTVQREGCLNQDVETFFLKSVPHDIEDQASIIEESNVFYKEANFHKLIVPELTRNFKDKSWGVSCYLVKDDAMVFEDLTSRKFTVRGKILDTPALKSALAGLAKLHVSSILAEKRLGKSLIELYPKVLQESIFNLESRFSEWFHTGVEVAVAVAKSLSLDSTNVPGICHRIFELVSASRKWRNVVCHGDAWSYNLMFDDSKPQPTCIMVDYQLVRYAPAMADVAQLIYLTTKRPYRDEHEVELLKHYHEVFRQTLEENLPGSAEDQGASFSELWQEYEEMRLVGIVTAALYFPINQIEGKLCAEMTKDSDGFSKLLFQDRSQLVLHLMRKDPNYRERITEVIKEMVQRSKRLLA